MRWRTSRWVRALAGLLALSAVAAVGLVPASPAGAAGETTHAWMDETAIDKVTSPQLHALLEAHKEYVRSGAFFPDSGYYSPNQYGEEAHWQRFIDSLVKQIRSRADCPDLTAVNGPCAPLIAFMMGAAGHGMGDEVWDWLFEPNVPDLNEYYTPADLAGYADEGGAELQMDIIAIATYGRTTEPVVAFPDHADLLAAFNNAGFTDVDEAHLELGEKATNVVATVEGAVSPTHVMADTAAMPWMSHNLITGPGAVEFAGTAIAGYWDNTWGQLLGAQPATKVSITYPAPDQRRIPATGWVRDHSPGSSRGNGGARTRIAAALTYARPYDPLAGVPTVVSNDLPAGSMTLTDRDTGDPVAVAAGYPRLVPYGASDGEHLIDIEPAADLSPCTWYTAATTALLTDAHGQPVTPYSWDFRTGTGADGNRCPDDPYTPDENFARKATSDLLGRPATEADLQNVDYTFARGATRKGFVSSTLSSTEERSKLVTDTYEHYLGRAPDAGGLSYWSTKLGTITMTELVAQLVSTPEAYRTAGGTDLTYVQALYPLILGRNVDAVGARYWSDRLGEDHASGGVTRNMLVTMLLTSHESSARIVAAAFQTLLGRAPDAGGAAYWTGVLQTGADPRTLWQSITLTSEYDRLAQSA